MTATVLFDNGLHQCVCFHDLLDEAAIQINQFVIVDNGQGLLIDPGGNMAYKRLFTQINQYVATANIQYVFASHADPDVISCLNGLLLMTDATVMIAEEWVRFLPHFCEKGVRSRERLQTIPAEGMKIQLGRFPLRIVPGHYLHTVGNFHLYDPISKLLFSGDVGAAVADGEDALVPVTDFEQHIEQNGVRVSHQRYMSGNKAARLWVEMVRKLNVEGIVPQHGAPYMGKQMVSRFLSWFETLDCGIDLL